MGSDGIQGTTLETGGESARREVSPEETAYAGSLATSESVEKVMEARSSGLGADPLYLQGVLAELHRQAADRSRRARTAQSAL